MPGWQIGSISIAVIIAIAMCFSLFMFFTHGTYYVKPISASAFQFQCVIRNVIFFCLPRYGCSGCLWRMRRSPPNTVTAQWPMNPASRKRTPRSERFKSTRRNGTNCGTGRMSNLQLLAAGQGAVLNYQQAAKDLLLQLAEKLLQWVTESMQSR